MCSLSSIREFDLILIYLPHFDWNSPNRIRKFKNPNIPPKIHSQRLHNNTFKFHVRFPFPCRSLFSKASCFVFRRTWCRILSNRSLGSTINIRLRSSRSPSSCFVTYSYPWSAHGRFLLLNFSPLH